MKKLSTILILVTVCLAMQSSVNRITYSSKPPAGLTGATGSTCTNCHSSYDLNSGGGNVSVTGLPTSDYLAGKKYDFELTINHGIPDRKRWGFSIKAVDGTGNSVGTFSSTNSEASPNGKELSHSNAVATSASNTYTFSNLHWVAPTKTGQAINFYFVGNAADNSGDNQGDYIYTSVSSISLPLLMKDFSATVVNDAVQLNWQTLKEVNSSFFTVQKSVDGQRFNDVTNVNISSNSTSAKYSYSDASPLYFGRSIFYRLKIVDKEGKIAYSSVVSAILKAKGIEVVSVYPNTLNAGSTAVAKIISDKNENVNILILDASGRILQNSSQSIVSGNNNIKFIVNSTIKKGMVYVRFITGTSAKTLPLFVN